MILALDFNKFLRSKLKTSNSNVKSLQIKCVLLTKCC